MITKEKWDAFRSVNKIKTEMEDHITKALQEIFKIYGGELRSWYYPGAPPGGMGEMIVCGGNISIATEGGIDIKSEAWYEDKEYSGYLTSEFPVHFLFLSINEVRDTVSKFKLKFEKQERLKKQKASKNQKSKKLKNEKLIKAAVKKLTAEEKKALGISE